MRLTWYENSAWYEQCLGMSACQPGASQPGTSQQHARISWSMSSHYNPVTDHPFSGMSSPPALIHKRKRNEVTADAASQDATPPPKKATHPEDYTLTCCICRKRPWAAA
jgi:hypothetical protein